MDVHLRAARHGGQPSHVGMSSLACQRKLALESGERRLAEGEGFEPPVPFRVQWFSRPPPSTTRPSLRVEQKRAKLRPHATQVELRLLSHVASFCRIVTSHGDSRSDVQHSRGVEQIARQTMLYRLKM